jgi:hypothetical protein
MIDVSPDEAPPPEPLSKGIACPRCKGTRWRVWVTRRMPGRLVRVRTCADCRLRVRTKEIIEAVGGDPQEAA